MSGGSRGSGDGSVVHPAPRGLTALEIIGGFPCGTDPEAPGLPPPTGEHPLAAFERAVLPALRRPPCVVSFSGGRDSSAVLAVATRVARRHGLPTPIPITKVIPAAPASHEGEWQELVVRHLGLTNWTKIELVDELDLVGPMAQRVLRRHGRVWPPNAHFHEPLLQAARGGSLLTGIAGDGLFATWQWARPMRLLDGGTRPQPRDALRVAKALAPEGVRRSVDNRRKSSMPEWIRPPAARAISRAWVADAATEPLSWKRRVDWFARRRSLRLTMHSMSLMAQEHDVVARHPLADPVFLSELAAARPWRGFPDRTRAMAEIFGSVLPREVVERRTKAHFSEAVALHHTREFVRDWTGNGVDPALVDHDRLREAWLAELPLPSTSMLLQAAWLAENAAGDIATPSGRMSP